MVYTLKDFDENEEGQEISFYEMNEDGTKERGTTLEEMLRVSIERLRILNSKFQSKENIDAIDHMVKALVRLNARTKDRIERGVEGKHEA